MLQGGSDQVRVHFRKQLCIRMIQQIPYNDVPINVTETSMVTKNYFTC